MYSHVASDCDETLGVIHKNSNSLSLILSFLEDVGLPVDRM